MTGRVERGTLCKGYWWPDVKALIVGCGSIGQRHLANLKRLAVVEVVAYRQRGRNAARLEAEFGVRSVLHHMRYFIRRQVV